MSEFYESALNAYVRGDGLDVSDRRTAVVAAKTAGLKPHYFKKTELLPRVRRVIGFLRGVEFTSILDVGSGR